jgi:AcrR family transcriptional regulator
MNDEAPELELPRGVALAWGIAANPQRGPKRELSIERIVEAAVTIADAEGLAAVSMASVAASLGFTTMSLYRYVTSKDDLILLMQEFGIGLPSSAIVESTNWRAGLERWSRESLEHYEAHPWLVDIPILGSPNTPNNLAWMDAALALLRDTPLPLDEQVGALLLVSGQTRFEATVMRGYAVSNRAMGLTDEERDLADAHIIMNLVTAEQFPALHAAIQGGAFGPGEDNPFEFGLSRVLDGIEHYIGTLKGGAPAAAAPTPHFPTDAHPKDEAVRIARQARREAEARLREAQKREREAIKRAAEREREAGKRAAERERAQLQRDAAAEAKAAAKQAR